MTFIELDPKTGELKEVEPPKANPEIIAAYNHWLKRGKWIAQDESYTKFMCSECKGRNYGGHCKYCPNCGAKMDGD